ncbi:hypothetical protein EIP86_005425 [Pleurotus ostreatoroseus]|nr:hypothetical protein EIP86_005425 [Pleurotus ostreatoroseus]
MTVSNFTDLPNEKAAEYERLGNFFAILASGDRDRYAQASTMLKAHTTRARVQEPVSEPVDVSKTRGECSARRRDAFFEEAELEKIQGPAPTSNTMSEFTFKMTIKDIYGAKRWREMVEELLRVSREMFRPLAEMQTRQTIARAATAELAERAKAFQDGSIRLKRPTKKRCVGRDKRAGADSDTLEWFYETTDASSEHATAVDLRARKVSLAPISPVSVSGSQPVSPICEYLADGARTRLAHDVLLSPKKRRFMEH